MRLKRTYSSREVAALTGLTARQLQLWDAGGLLSPTIPSHRTDAGGYTERRYTPIELFELLVLADLRRRWIGAAADRRRRDLRADRIGGVREPAARPHAAAARRRQRGHAAAGEG